MNKKGFTLVELLGCLAILATILCIGLYSARGTLATSLSTIDNITEKEITNIAKDYITENNTNWINNKEEYTCIKISDLISSGYLKDTTNYKNKLVKIVRDAKTKVIINSTIVEECNN